MNDAPPAARICLVSPSAFGELSGLPTGRIGGNEQADATMARWLARRGHAVSIITWDERQGDDAYAGIAVVKMCARDAGLRGLRFFHPRWTSLYGALRRAAADIYHYRGGDLELGQIAWWCRRHRKKCIYSVSSDGACDPRLQHLSQLRERLLYRYGLRHANLVTVQTFRQQSMMRDGFGIASEVVGTPNDMSPQVEQRPETAGPLRILWVGRIASEKRLDRLLEIATRLPQFQFDIAGGANEPSDNAAALVARAEKLANVTVHGKVARAQLNSLYQGASALCCTSEYEGFPQVFIEAWRYGVPVVSTVDPDGVISRFGLGRVASDVDGLVAALTMLLMSSEERRRAAAAARSYVAEHCSVEVTMSRFEKLFSNVLSVDPAAIAPPRGRL